MSVLNYITIALLVLSTIIFIIAPFRAERRGDYPMALVCLLFIVTIYFLVLDFKVNEGYRGNNSVNQIANTNPEKISKNELKFDEHDSKIYNIKVNPMTEYDGKTKQEVWDIRKKYVSLYPEFINKDYEPTPSLFNGIVDGKPWWGIDGIVCKGNTINSIDGPTRLSNMINNPMVLITLGDIFALHDAENPYCHGEWPKVTEFTFQPSTKTFNITYDVSSFFKGRKPGYFYNHRFSMPFFLLADLNARDFGYEYGFVTDYKKITFDKKEILENIIKFEQFLATGSSCNQPNGCNNIGPPRPNFSFKFNKLPAHIFINLYKERPKDKNTEPDLIYNMYFI